MTGPGQDAVGSGSIGAAIARPDPREPQQQGISGNISELQGICADEPRLLSDIKGLAIRDEK
jgi:hypothetical protein